MSVDLLDLRKKAIEASVAYFKANEKSKSKDFIPGTTYIPVTVKVVDEHDLESLIDASLDMWLTTGRFGAQFERMLPKYFNMTVNALLVNSGSSANLCGISSFGSSLLTQYDFEPIQKGAEVITSAGGFPTTINPIIQNQWKPVFVDIDPETLNARTEDILQSITPQTKAIVLAHALGNPYRSDILAKECRAKGIYLFEDCCDAFGAKIGDAPVGTFGDYASLSFYPAHHITMGEGGAVLSRTKALRRVAESMRDWGRDCWCEPGKDNTCGKRYDWKLGELPEGYDHKYTYSSIGYNLKVTDMQAALGVSQLSKVNDFVLARNSNWKKLQDGILASPLLSEHLNPIKPTPGTTPSWFGFPVNVRSGISRNEIVKSLEDRKIGTRLFFGGNILKQPAYKNIDCTITSDLQGCDFVMNNTFWIGVHPGLNDAMIEYMLSSLEEVIASIL
jgi:CDP-6-deoxy-D-xylo-4-hexulose-3-dehydrase